MNISTLLQMAAFFFVGLLTACVAINALPDSSATSTETGLTEIANDAETEAARRTATTVSTSDLLSDFEKFAPANSTLLCVSRPARIFESSIVKLAPPFAADTAPDGLKDIEFMAYAGTEKSLRNITTYRTNRAFARIAAALEEGKTAVANDAPAPTSVNFLNHDFGGLIQFKNTTDWTPFKTYFRSDDEFDAEFFETEWDGYRILECDQEDSCVVIQLDSRTFVVGNKTHLTAALSSGKSKCKTVSKWIADYAATNFDGEVAFAIDLRSETENLLSDMLPLIQSSIKDFSLAIDLRENSLMRCRATFAKPNESQKLISETKSHTSQWIQHMEIGLKAEVADEPFHTWQTRQGLAIAKSIKFEATETTASITIPRPVDFEVLVQEYSQRMNSVFQRIERSHEQFGQTGVEPFEPFEAVGDSSVRMSTVAVANKSIPQGTIISADDVNLENWPAQIIPEDALRNRKSVLNRKAAAEMRRGMPIFERNLIENK